MVMRNPKHHLRARGNLSYLQFVRLVGTIWEETQPKDSCGEPLIRYLPEGVDDPATYPSILYSLDLRRPHPTDPKPRLREIIDDQTGDPYVITAQRFQSVVKFTAITERDPELCSELIESFEDFMMEHVPIFKEFGASELVYSRRYSDFEENRSSLGVERRAVAYLLTTEKLTSAPVGRLEEIIARIRQYDESDIITTHSLDRGSSHDIRPRYYLYGSNAYLTFRIDTVPSAPDPILEVVIPGTNFRSNDLIHLNNFQGGTDFPQGLTEGLYRIIAPINDEAFTPDKAYSISKESTGDEPEIIEVTSTGSGVVYYVPEPIQVEIFNG